MVLVTGGTGLVGTHLLLHLLQNNTKVRAIYRKGSDLKQVEKVFSYYTEKATELFDTIDWVLADINSIPALEIAFRNVEYVYHAAALISFDPKDYYRLKKVNATGTANIVNLCLSNKIKKLCYVSSIAVIGKSAEGQKAHEENDWSVQDANVYALTKYRAEMEVWRGSQEGLEVVIVNPGVIIGPGFWGKGSGNLFTIANNAKNHYPPGGTGFITVNDVVEIMTTLMNSGIANQRFIAVAENITYKEILTTLAKALGKKGPSKMLKPWQLNLARFFDYSRSLLTGSKREITKRAIKSLMRPEIYDNQKIKDVLGFQFGDMKEAITFCCEKFKEENP
ncbi:MAG: NAD-dependent epimerase [Maribacter sp.]|nr:MAG: NAD-dependent epimerase [Maribacter sp.]